MIPNKLEDHEFNFVIDDSIYEVGSLIKKYTDFWNISVKKRIKKLNIFKLTSIFIIWIF